MPMQSRRDLGARHCDFRRSHESPLLARQARHPLRDGSRPGDRASARRHHQDHLLRHLRLRPALLRRLHARHEGGRHRRPRVHGRGGRGRLREQEAQGRRPGRRSVHHLLRRVRAVPARQLVGLRAHQPEEEPRRPRLRPQHRRPVRLHPHHRRLCRRPGGIRARALRRRRPGQDSRRIDRRAGALSRRHLPHRLAGRGAVRHPADRHGRGLGRGAGRPVRDPQRRHARRRAGDLHRQRARAARHGARRRRRSRSTSTRRACSTGCRS